MKGKKRGGGPGFTLVEVIAAFAVLLLAVGLFSFSIAAASGMERHAGQLRRAGNEIGKRVLAGTEGIEGTVSLELDGWQIEGKGYLYMEETDYGEGLRVIWVEECTERKPATDSNAGEDYGGMQTEEAGE